MGNNSVYYSVHTVTLPRIEREERGQEDESNRAYIVRNRHLTGSKLAASLNSIYKTPVSTLTVKWKPNYPGFKAEVERKSHIWH